jgi:phosphoglycerate-specific signal transduction histidine kinase
MIQWQGYQEAVSMLRDILRLQEELKNETRDRVREEGKGLFDE